MKIKMITTALICGFIFISTPSITAAACDWSVGRYQSGNTIKSSPLPTAQCTWYVDGKTDRSNWDLVFNSSTGRDAKKWYNNNLIKNANRGTIGYPGDIMVLNASSSGHVAYITNNGYWKGKRAWTVRHANWTSSLGQTSVETQCGVSINQCTFVEDTPGKVKVVYYDSKQKKEVLGGTAYPLIGFLYKK